MSKALVDGDVLHDKDLAALAARDFGTFFEFAFKVLHGGKSPVYARYIDLLIKLMTLVCMGFEDRVIINLPPGFMKSTIVSVIYTAWRLGVDPTCKIVCISYGDELANRLSRETRRLMQSSFYRRVFPGTILAKKSENHLVTTKGGYRYATMVNSDITGFRPKEIIVDDPMEPMEAASELKKSQLREWIANSVMTRFDGPDGRFVLVMHRLAFDDITATLSENPDFSVFALPLVAEEDEEAEVDGEVVFRRAKGEILNPGRMRRSDVDRIRREVGTIAFNAQYQQRPDLIGSGYVSVDRLRRYTAEDLPKFELEIHSWDIGATTAGNPSVCTKWGLSGDNELGDLVYLLGVIEFKGELPDVRMAIKTHDRLNKPDLILVDDRGVGLSILQELRAVGLKYVVGASTGSDSNEGKMDRLSRAMLRMYDGRVVFPTDAPFIGRVLADLAAAPSPKTWDLIDSMTQLLANLDKSILFARQRRRHW